MDTTHEDTCNDCIDNAWYEAFDPDNFDKNGHYVGPRRRIPACSSGLRGEASEGTHGTTYGRTEHRLALAALVAAAAMTAMVVFSTGCALEPAPTTAMPDWEMECQSSTDCDDGYYCELVENGSRCSDISSLAESGVGTPCGQPEDCQFGLVCIDAQCELPECQSYWDCPALEICAEGTCAATEDIEEPFVGSPCDDGWECFGSLVCLDGACQRPECKTDAECSYLADSIQPGDSAARAACVNASCGFLIDCATMIEAATTSAVREACGDDDAEE